MRLSESKGGADGMTRRPRAPRLPHLELVAYFQTYSGGMSPAHPHLRAVPNRPVSPESNLLGGKWRHTASNPLEIDGFTKPCEARFAPRTEDSFEHARWFDFQRPPRDLELGSSEDPAFAEAAAILRVDPSPFEGACQRHAREDWGYNLRAKTVIVRVCAKVPRANLSQRVDTKASFVEDGKLSGVPGLKVSPKGRRRRCDRSAQGESAYGFGQLIPHPELSLRRGF